MTATANASSSSVTSRPEALRVDLAAAGLLPPIPAALLAGRETDLLAPLRFLAPGALPPPAPPAPASRAELARALETANAGYGHPKAAQLARRLADPAVQVVVTGQQPGLFGGPLYAFSKMIAAALWAEALEREGVPAVALYWVATEDHDWAEVSSAAVLGAQGPWAVSLGPDPEPLVPVGMRTLGPAVEPALAALAEAVPGDLYAEWLRTLARWYRPEARFGEAFCRLMVHLMGDSCPLLLDAMLPALKSAERPWLSRLVERRAEVEEALAGRDAEIARRGLPLQISPQRGASPLFLLHRGERRRIEWKGDGFLLRGRGEGGGTIEELLRIVDENPGVVSPGALARPAVQDAVLGTCLQVLGPGEVSYMAQSSAVYPILEVEPPTAALRPQAIVLEPRQAERLAESGLSLADLLGERAAVDRALARRGDGDLVADARHQVEEALAGLRSPALALDPTLERPFEKTREQVLRALDLFAEKVTGAAARKDQVALHRVESLREVCLPFGKLQERAICCAHFGGRYGPRFPESFREQLALDPAHLQVVMP
jgi:bacillithiol synthase